MSLASIVLPVAFGPEMRMPAPSAKSPMSRPRTVTSGPVIVRPSASPAWLPLELDERCAGVTRLREPVDQDRPGDRGQGRERARSSGLPGPGWRSRSCSVPPVAALESRIACLKEPGPLSAVVFTRNVDSSVRSSMNSTTGRRRKLVPLNAPTLALRLERRRRRSAVL